MDNNCDNKKKYLSEIKQNKTAKIFTIVSMGCLWNSVQLEEAFGYELIIDKIEQLTLLNLLVHKKFMFNLCQISYTTYLNYNKNINKFVFFFILIVMIIKIFVNTNY